MPFCFLKRQQELVEFRGLLVTLALLGAGMAVGGVYLLVRLAAFVISHYNNLQ